MKYKLCALKKCLKICIRSYQSVLLGNIKLFLTWGKSGLSSLFFFRHSAINLFMAFGQLLRTLLRSGDRYPRPTIKIIWGGKKKGKSYNLVNR